MKHLVLLWSLWQELQDIYVPQFTRVISQLSSSFCEYLHFVSQKYVCAITSPMYLS